MELKSPDADDLSQPRPPTLQANQRTCFWCGTQLQELFPKNPDLEAHSAWLGCPICDKLAA